MRLFFVYKTLFRFTSNVFSFLGGQVYIRVRASRAGAIRVLSTRRDRIGSDTKRDVVLHDVWFFL